jgi:hypothetical protein
VKRIKTYSALALLLIISVQTVSVSPARSTATIPLSFKSLGVGNWDPHQHSQPPSILNGRVGAVFPPCTSKIKTDCIISVEYQNAGGKWIQGKFDQPIPYKYTPVVTGTNSITTVTEETSNPISEKEDAARNIPALSRGGYWSFPGLKQSGIDKFLVDFVAVADMSNQENPLAVDSRAIWRGIQLVRISPVTPLVLKTSEIKSKDYKGGAAFSGCGGYGKNDKAFCWLRKEFMGDPAFRISVRLNKTAELLESSLWFTARVKSSAIGVTKDANGTVITFTGKPVMIGNAEATLPRDKSTYDLVNKLSTIESKLYDPRSESTTVFTYRQWNEENISLGYSTESLASVDQWIALESVAPIKMMEENSVWRFTPAEIKRDVYQKIWGDKCISTGGVMGMASSNAAVFVPTIPAWNSETGSLDFQIASTHLNKAGKLNIGYYGISISEKVAKCLWGVNSTKISAQISVTNRDEQKTIKLTSSSEKGGFYNFNVSGFHYSAPKFSLKIQKP